MAPDVEDTSQRARIPTRRVVLTTVALLAIVVAAWLLIDRPRQPAQTIHLFGETMATTYNVKIVGGDETSRGALSRLIDTALQQINGTMSLFDGTSEVAKFNRWHSLDPFPASSELIDVLETSLAVAELSEGAFDVTVAPLVRLWGFHNRPMGHKPPDAEKVDSVRRRVGYHLLEIDRENQRLRKHVPELELDLSSIAKGYGVDHIARALTRSGYKDYLVEIGGEVRTSGLSGRASPWRVAVELPVPDRREIFEVVNLSDRAMATSGDYRNFYRHQDQQLSHTVDPRTGAPIAHSLASVTVVDENCTMADGLATALNVLGPQDGLTLARKLSLTALFLVREQDGSFSRLATPEFDRQQSDTQGRPVSTIEENR